MHTFTPRWAESWREAHDVVPHAHTFTEATDLIAFAEFDRLTLWRSWPEIWHLDSSGAVLCSSRGLSTDTVRSMVDDPRALLGCRLVPSPGCPDNWVVFEHRRAGQRGGMDVTDDDVTAFARLRGVAADAGVTLLDVVVVNDALQWWSLGEMSSGTTEWTFDVAPAPPGRRLTGPSTRRRAG
jgi:hypothetical protein